MSAKPIAVAGGPPRLVGQVFAEITVRNADDAARARAGDVELEDVREIMLDEVLVDTGATHLCLPANLVAALGLGFRREIVLSTAGGTRRARLLGPAEIEVAGRETWVEIIELPEGLQPLLGVIPMESLGLEPDLAGQRLRLLPETGPSTHFTAY